MVEILFVHGALVRDGAWWWQPTARLLEERLGVRSRAVALPSCGEGAEPGAAGLGEDAAVLRTALDAAEDGAVVVGHSYGGTVIAEGADHSAARHLVLISSYLPDPGEAQAAIMSGEPDPVAVEPDADDTVRLAGYDVERFAARFLQDVPDRATREAAFARVTRQSITALGTPTTLAAWRDRPSTALVCADDRSTTVELQRRHASRATRSVELPTGHHPFLSRPDLVAEELAAVLRSLDG